LNASFRIFNSNLQSEIFNLQFQNSNEADMLRVVALLLMLASAVTVGTADQQTPPASPPPAATTTPPPATTSTAKPQIIGTMSELMVNLIYPTSDAILYIETRTPTNDVEWNELRAKALMLAEAANLLMMPSRARDQGQWMDDAKLMLDAGTAAFKAVKSRDVQALIDLNEKMVASCTTCHRHYRDSYGRGARGAAPQK
jgi:hypothetical protein